MAGKLYFPTADDSGVTMGAPKVDGFVGSLLEADDQVWINQLDDTGYNRGGRVTFHGGGKPSVVVQTVKAAASDFIYLGFYVRFAETFHEGNVIILCLRPAASTLAHGPQTRRFDIFPVWDQADFGAENHLAGDPTLPATDDFSHLGILAGQVHDSAFWKLKSEKTPRLVHYYAGVDPGTSSNIPWQRLGPQLPANVDIKVRSLVPVAADLAHDVRQQCVWSVEVKLPMNAGSDWIDLHSTFKIFLDVVRIESIPPVGAPPDPDPLQGLYNTQFVWPNDPSALRRLEGNLANTNHFKIDPAWYGDAVVGASAAASDGVRFVGGSESSVGVRDPGAPPFAPLSDTIISTADTGPAVVTNRLVAQVENRGPTVAEKVHAHFLFAQWGINANATTPPDWVDAKTEHAVPVVDGVDIAPGQAVELTYDWPSNKVRQIYGTTGFHGWAGDHCTLVFLDSSENAVFAQSSVRRNISFKNMSKTKHDVRVSAFGQPAPAGGRPFQKMVLITNVRPLTEITEVFSSGSEVGLLVESMVGWEYAVHGYVDVGEALTIEGTTFRSLSPAGDYNYMLSHPPSKDELQHNLELKPGNDPVAKISSGSNTVHVLHVPVDGHVTLLNTLKTRPAKPAPGSGWLAWLVWVVLLFLNWLKNLF